MSLSLKSIDKRQLLWLGIVPVAIVSGGNCQGEGVGVMTGEVV